MSPRRLDVHSDGDVARLWLTVMRRATRAGLDARRRSAAAVAVTEVAGAVVARSGGATVHFGGDGRGPGGRFEVSVEAHSRGGPGGRPDPAGGADAIGVARRIADAVVVEGEPGTPALITLAWVGGDPGEGDRMPGPTGDPGGREAAALVVETANQALLGVLGLLERSEAELARQAGEARWLAEELEETNRGLIALHAELESSHESEARLAAIVRSSEDAMFSMTPEAVVVTWNPGAEALLGYPEAEIVGKPVRVLLPPELVADLSDTIARVSAGEPAGRHDTWWVRRDGSTVEVSLALSAIRDAAGGLLGYSAVMSDLTERRRGEEELSAARASQEVFAERDRIAADLHDLVIQRLFASGMVLQGTLTLVDRPDLVERISRVIDDLDLTIGEIRSTIFALGHEPLLSVNLRRRLLDVAAQAAEALGFDPLLRFKGPVDAMVSGAVVEHVVAVTREALSNAARHAHASSVRVSLEVGDVVVLEVADDGCGLGEVTRSSGLANMARRAAGLGGTFEVTSEPGQGTRLVWRVPAGP